MLLISKKTVYFDNIRSSNYYFQGYNTQCHLRAPKIYEKSSTFWTFDGYVILQVPTFYLIKQ